MTIPKNLCKGEFRFVLIRCGEKGPFELKWESQNNYAFNNETLLRHVKNGGNYGILCGKGNLIVIDADTPEITQIVNGLPPTFRVRTGSGNTHDYFICPGIEKKIVLQKGKEHFGEIQSTGAQVVAPGSVHPNGNEYKIINDIEIASISADEIIEAFKPYIKSMNEPLRDWNNEISRDTDINSLPITGIIPTTGFKTRGGELYGANPWHGSSSGMNLWINPSKNVAYCFRCGKGINPAQAIALNEGIIHSCDDSMDREQFKVALEAAHKKYGLKEKKKIDTDVIANRKNTMNDLLATFRDYKSMAAEFVRKHPLYYDKNCIWWSWNAVKFKWEMVDDIDIMNLIDDAFSVIDSTKSYHKNEILESLKRIGRKQTPKEAKKTWLQFNNKIIDVVTSETMDATPEYFITNPLPWAVGESQDTPVMDKIFTEWVGNENIRLLYEIIAYAALPDYPLSRIFCFLGSGSNGKTTYLELVKRFVGCDNVTSTELETLIDNRFESAKLHRKLVCFMGETNSSKLERTSILKKLSGSDLVGFEYKNKTPFDGINYAKLMIATNTLPSTEDKTSGFYRRWVIIDFPQTFNEKRNILAEIPEDEYKALACKCIGILRDILLNREFTNEGTIDQRMQKFEDKSNPLDKFIKEKTKESFEGHILKQDFRKELDVWCKVNGYRKISDRELAKNMKERFREVFRLSGWGSESSKKEQMRAWEGIEWI